MEGVVKLEQLTAQMMAALDKGGWGNAYISAQNSPKGHRCGHSGGTSLN